MARVVLRTPEARRETLRIYVRLALDSDEVADRFLEKLESTCDRLARMPGIGAPIEGLPTRLAGTRCMTVDRFPNHVIFYRETEESIEVLHVLHAARDLVATLLGEESD